MRKRTRREQRRKQRNQRRFSILLVCSGWAASSSGVLFLIWGYIHREDAPRYADLAAQGLSIVVPLLFLAALAGTYAKFKTQKSLPSLIGFIISFAGIEWLAIRGIMRAFGKCGLCLPPNASLLLDSPLTWLCVGMCMVGLTAFRKAPIRHWGSLVLAMALCGWGYQLTDERYGLVDVRAIHVAFGILFALTWMLLGYALRSSKTDRADKLGAS